MRILFAPAISNPFPVRGYQIFSRLAKRHEVYVLHPEKYGQGPSEFDTANFHRINMSLPFLVRDKYTPRSTFLFYSSNIISCARSIIRTLREYSIDIIIHNDPIIGVMMTYLSKERGIATTFDYVDYTPAFFHEYLPHLPLINDMGGAFGRIIENYLIKNNDLIVAIGSLLEENAKRKNKNVILIPNGVDPHRFNPNISGEEVRKRHKIPDDAFVFCFLGSLSFWVMFDDALRAFSRVHREHQNTLFMVIGPDPRYCAMNFRMGEKEGVLFIGQVPYREVPEYLAATDVCVLPFRLSNATHAGLPIKMQEYAASGKAIVSTPLMDVKRFYGDAVIYAERVDQFQSAFEIFLKDEELREYCGRRAREIVVKRFDWEKLATVYEHELVELIKKG